MSEQKLIEFIEAKAKQHNVDPAGLIEEVQDVYNRQKDNEDTEKADKKALKDSVFYSLNSIEQFGDGPRWTFMAATLDLQQLYQQAMANRGTKNPYDDFYGLVKMLTDKGLYSTRILEKYTKEDIEYLAKLIDPSKDELFNFIGLYMLKDRYLTKDYDKAVYELPQERWMIIAMYLMQDEIDRLHQVQEAYWALSSLFMTVATPTLSNTGKSHGQLSSCFIDTVEDSLDGIYLNNWDTARLSKGGGGISVYMGKVRAVGSSIQGFKDKSSGVVPWIKQLNNTAVAVDQLGQRQGAIAVYLDVWHKDFPKFADLRLNNGDERLRAYDIFTGACVPDIFMQRLEDKDENGKSIGMWSLFDPHEVKEVMGWVDEHGNKLGLEDFYDEKEQKYFTEKYLEAEACEALSRTEVRAMSIMARIMKSQLETGLPYMFYRDEVNRKNPNKHRRGKGRTSIYSSNLCTEIAQNMSPTTVVDEYLNENKDMVLIRRPGEFVVCNLSSINLARAKKANVLERLIPIQVRMLDNVIDLNTLPLLQAKKNNMDYRAIGLGTFGWHHHLALSHIMWDSEESVKHADEVYEEIAYLAIKASCDLALEKGCYPYFHGSQWQTGEYFIDRGYVDEDGNNLARYDWAALKDRVAKIGMRNGYVMAVAPNSSTAKIGGSSDGVDPIYGLESAEEKKDFKIPVTAPDVDIDICYDVYYRSERYMADQHMSIKQNAARQRHVDQSISLNLYVRYDIPAKDLLALHLHAWKAHLKSTYYIRSTSQEGLLECESCAS